MQVFCHLVYEYQKGLRDLSLFTCSVEQQEKLKKSLDMQKINYLIYPLVENKINVFFGEQDCLDIVENFSSSDLSKITHEEDFMLGIMLGYGKAQQYKRFLNRAKKCA